MAPDKDIPDMWSVYLIVKGIVSYLSASDASSFLSAIGVSTDPYKKAGYLDPIRDFDSELSFIHGYSRRTHRSMLIGRDVLCLVDRINDPEKYWKEGYGENKLRIWLAVIPLRALKNDWRKLRMDTATGRIEAHMPSIQRANKWNYAAMFEYVFKPSNSRLMLKAGWTCTGLPNSNRIHTIQYHRFSVSPLSSAFVVHIDVDDITNHSGSRAYIESLILRGRPEIPPCIPYIDTAVRTSDVYMCTSDEGNNSWNKRVPGREIYLHRHTGEHIETFSIPIR